jgi:hypothetical protein
MDFKAENLIYVEEKVAAKKHQNEKTRLLE